MKSQAQRAARAKLGLAWPGSPSLGGGGSRHRAGRGGQHPHRCWRRQAGCRRRAAPRGRGLKSPFQATMFQVCEQHPPTPKANFQNFLLAWNAFLLTYLSLPFPMISPSLREVNPPPDTGCLSICRFRMAQAGAWSLDFRSRWGGSGRRREEGGVGGGYVVTEIDL